ncbi:translation initiation factor IF-2-like [Dryobates pubescens]|uniref:translation initiation factor IF-2-like n=1 Tax=Dryobates pubescens TaxID=118200 RepID=UPI0023B95823|nr:translation initiation factor IF-2-like [Dryobates pubescens]
MLSKSDFRSPPSSAAPQAGVGPARVGRLRPLEFPRRFPGRSPGRVPAPRGAEEVRRPRPEPAQSLRALGLRRPRPRLRERPLLPLPRLARLRLPRPRGAPRRPPELAAGALPRGGLQAFRGRRLGFSSRGRPSASAPSGSRAEPGPSAAVRQSSGAARGEPRGTQGLDSRSRSAHRRPPLPPPPGSVRHLPPRSAAACPAPGSLPRLGPSCLAGLLSQQAPGPLLRNEEAGRAVAQLCIAENVSQD